MLFRHIRFHIIVVWKCLKEAFSDDGGRTGMGSVNLENRIVIVIVTGYSPIQCDMSGFSLADPSVIVTEYSPIPCD